MTEAPLSTRPPATVTRLPGPRVAAPPSLQGSLQGSLALDLPAPERRRPPRRVGPAEAEVSAWSHRFAQAAVEVVTGQRPVVQLLRWTDERVYAELEQRALVVARARGAGHQQGRASGRRVRPQVSSVHVCRPHDACAEVTVVVRHGARTRALALRLERHRDRWRCTVLRFL